MIEVSTGAMPSSITGREMQDGDVSNEATPPPKNISLDSN
jgi:hypothetical protein